MKSMKAKSMTVPETVFHDIEINTEEVCNSEDITINLKPDDIITVLVDKYKPEFYVAFIGKEPFPKDQDIYFVAFDGTPYRAKKETFEFSSEIFGIDYIKAEFEQIKDEGKQ